MAIEAPEQPVGDAPEQNNPVEVQPEQPKAADARLTPAEIMRKQLDLYDLHTRQHPKLDADELVEAARRRVREAGDNFDELGTQRQLAAMNEEHIVNEAQRATDEIVGDVASMVPRPNTEFQRQYNAEFQARMAASRERNLHASRPEAADLLPPASPAYIPVTPIGESVAPDGPRPKLRHKAVHAVRRFFGRTGRHRADKNQEELFA